ncbi:LPS export ABC transporter periplasmic protein LptC [Nitrosophilus alvini]|uniref:LPS export ABC transporter periplasmic protein LptC n=1 Tax=Nitrosophilus alvini TaxID=2714855 RepID=UPI00190D8840|nr:LPS export ABC transporter periplasmic protein LptC [Nitrosophilus alvini]
MKLSHFLFFILAGSLLWTLFMKPRVLEKKEAKSTAELVFKNFLILEIEQEGIKKNIIGQEGRKFADRYEIDKIKYFKKNGDFEELTAKRGVYKNDIVRVFGDVVYKKGKDFIFKSQRAKYDTKKEIVSTDTKFTLITKSAVVNGRDLIYYRKRGKILAKKIDAKIFENGKI